MMTNMDGEPISEVELQSDIEGFRLARDNQRIHPATEADSTSSKPKDTPRLIENREGPIQKVSIEMSIDEYASVHPSESVSWLYSHVIDKLPPGSLKDSIVLARKEQELRQQNKKDRWGESLVPGSEQYAFRCYMRRSDGKPIDASSDATHTQAEENIFRYGMESPAYTMIMPNTIWNTFFVPMVIDMDKGIDISTILVYGNRPFVIPPEAGQSTTTIVDVSEPVIKERAHEISVDDVKKLDLPTLKDNLVGQVEIKWKASNKRRLLKKLNRL